MITVFIISFLICFSYIYYVHAKFGVSSISESYYRFEQKKKGHGMLFWAWSVLTAFSLLPCWLEASGEGYQFVAFLSSACLIAVGCCPNYKGEHKSTHPLFTATAAVLAITWGFLAGVWYLIISIIATTAGVAIYVHRDRLKANKEHGWSYALTSIKFLLWIEIAAFAGIYLSVMIKMV